MAEKKKSKKPTKRNKRKFANLYPNLNLKSRYEEIEDLYSYMDKLDEDCKAWLDKFAKEYINASFEHKDPLHNKEQQREIYNRNNERNRCVLTRMKAYGNVNYLEETIDEASRVQNDLTEEEAEYKAWLDKVEED